MLDMEMDATVPERDRLEPLEIALQPSLVAMVAERLIDAILRGRLAAGERIIETRIAEQLGVSRSPLREALKKLEAEGLVASRKGRGTFVVSPGPGDYERMVPVRAILEGQAARSLAGQEVELVPLLERNRQLKEAAVLGDPHACSDAGWRFHATLVQLAGNPYLTNAWQSLSILVRQYMHRNDVYARDTDLTLRVHDFIVDTIRAGDPDRAEQCLRGLVTLHGFAMVGKPVPRDFEGYVSGIGPDRFLNSERGRSR